MYTRDWIGLALAAGLGTEFNTEGKPFTKIIPTDREMPTPKKYLRVVKPKNPKKKKRGY